jgi:hypothetical protein
MIVSTFINALLSFPVHCLNRRPCGKRRKPGKFGTAASLAHRKDMAERIYMWLTSGLCHQECDLLLLQNPMQGRCIGWSTRGHGLWMYPSQADEEYLAWSAHRYPPVENGLWKAVIMVRSWLFLTKQWCYLNISIHTKYLTKCLRWISVKQSFKMLPIPGNTAIAEVSRRCTTSENRSVGITK